MKANYENKSTVNLGNLYEMNQQLMSREPVIDKEVLYEKTILLHNWIEDKYNSYYMLLNNDLHDYTIFGCRDTFNSVENMNMSMADDVIECLTNRGELLALDKQENDTWEFWIRNSEGTFAYYLFPYDDAIILY